ncbi:MAG: hypothetical protein AAGA70_05580 [Pseudomonadota bacterium]
MATGAVAVALLVACGLGAFAQVSWLNFCRSPAALAAEEAQAAILQSNAQLIREIAALEAELATQQCTAVYPPPEIPTFDLPPPQPEIDERAWNDRDIAVLEGCWALDSNYRIRNNQTGIVTEFNEWTMCFTQDGGGREEMRSSDGAVTCAGPVTGSFNAGGGLVVAEPGNLQCSDDTFIYRRNLTCNLDGQGAANCVVVQPEVDTRDEVRLQRATGGP